MAGASNSNKAKKRDRLAERLVREVQKTLREELGTELDFVNETALQTTFARELEIHEESS